MGFTVTLKPSSIEVRPGELSRERTIQKILAADASAGRLVVFERPGKRTGCATSFDLPTFWSRSEQPRPRPIMSCPAPEPFATSSNPRLRRWRMTVEHARLDDRSFFSPAVSALPGVATSLSVSPH